MKLCYQQVPSHHAVPGYYLRSPSRRGPPPRLNAIPPGTPQIPWYHYLVLPLTLPMSYFHCLVVQVLEVLQKLLPTVCMEGARGLWLDKGHNAHADSSYISVGLAQLVFSLDCERIVNFCHCSIPSPAPYPLSSPRSPSFCSRFDQYSPSPSTLKILFRCQSCPRTAHCILYLDFLDFGGQSLQLVK